MARKKKKQLDLAEVLNITTATAARRLNGTVPFDVVELMVVANWLDVPVESLQPPTRAGAA
ncbi:BetR domain-containing protein [Nocardioides lianchengensis]|uniref:BetR domain-containing protein n=2 Tax=Nocardioides lianchengensis TaxID=1045774 RepID=A0A1G6LQ11_9ACTN|nr:BetR domain-containing protein [Nocardioides lianchengensis]